MTEGQKVSVQTLSTDLSISVGLSRTVFESLVKQRILRKQPTESTPLNGTQMPPDDHVLAFVGVVECHGCVLTCYPKYTTHKPFSLGHMQTVLRAIEKYNGSALSVSTFSDIDSDDIYNELALGVYLLRDYYENGIYLNEEPVYAVNGLGETDWTRTIEESCAIIQDGSPVYFDRCTIEHVDSERQILTRLHKCLLSDVSRHLETSGLDRLLSITTVELDDTSITELGDVEYLSEHISAELERQYVTRKRVILHVMQALLRKTGFSGNDAAISSFGTTSFHVIWEKACAEVLGDERYEQLAQLPVTLHPNYANCSGTKLIELMPHSGWTNTTTGTTYTPTETLEPDCLIIASVQGSMYFTILDAKYYTPRFSGASVSGVPGIQDIIKQQLYEAGYQSFATAHSLPVRNAFLFPSESSAVTIPYTANFSLLPNQSPVKALMIPANELLEHYVNTQRVDIATWFPLNFWT